MITFSKIKSSTIYQIIKKKLLLLNNFILTKTKIEHLRNNFYILFLLLYCSAVFPGPDFYRYLDWARVFQSQSWEQMSKDAISVSGTPLSQWSFGPGIIYSLVPSWILKTSDNTSLIFGFLLAIVFWITFSATLKIIFKENLFYIFLSIFTLIFATNGGFYILAQSSESISLVILSCAIFLLVAHNKSFHFSHALSISILSSLLFMIRSQFIFISAFLFFLSAFYLIKNKKSFPILHFFSFSLPSFFILLAMIYINKIMTGSYLKSPYQFGDNLYSSINLLNPKINTILTHPLHGLLTYHPIFIFFFLMTIFSFLKFNKIEKKLIILISFSIFLSSLYLYSAWYCWWLGRGTFGMRGLSWSSLPFTLLSFVYIQKYELFQKHQKTLSSIIVFSFLWSYLLLIQKNSWFVNWYDLAYAQTVTLIKIFPWIFLSTVFFLFLEKKQYSKIKITSHFLKRIVFFLTLSLLVLFLQKNHFWLKHQFTFIFLSLIFLKLGFILSKDFSNFNFSNMQTFQKRITQFLNFTIPVVFILICFRFTQFYIYNEKYLKEAQVLNSLEHNNVLKKATDVHLPEIEATYQEYLVIPGFEEEKNNLKNYLDRKKKAFLKSDFEF